MDATRIIGIGLLVTIFSLLLRQQRPEFSLALSVLGAAGILVCVLPYIKDVLVMFETMANQVGLESRYLRMIVKIIGVAYLCQFGAELCRDAGECSIASKIELGGKVMILALSMPVISSFLDLVSSIIHF